MTDSAPLCIDLYCGLGGWAEGFIAEGWRVRGFDIEAHDYGTGGYPGELILRDVRSIHGSELKDAACIVGSSPCQEFSYRAMPWKRAKALGPPLLGMELFQAQFRIQREASEAAGRYIPMKFSQSGDAWFDGKPRDKMLGDKGPAAYGSKSDSRKAASALIAKIPFALASHIARCYYPDSAGAPLADTKGDR